MESDEVRRRRRVEVTGSDALDKVLKVSAVEVRHVQAKRVRFLCEEKRIESATDQHVQSSGTVKGGICQTIWFGALPYFP